MNQLTATAKSALRYYKRYMAHLNEYATGLKPDRPAMRPIIPSPKTGRGPRWGVKTQPRCSSPLTPLKMHYKSYLPINIELTALTLLLHPLKSRETL